MQAGGQIHVSACGLRPLLPKPALSASSHNALTGTVGKPLATGGLTLTITLALDLLSVKSWRRGPLLGHPFFPLT